ncbi:MAG: glycosyl hydrolase family 16 [Lasallia pustulata]|uniref:Glycosyl hydrolase family 16 n=1 Tax=Lasallia pustulata TaxID=136370 RepID=A0A1W5D2M3_9LECA|nr:MAG: glycosyl hydrolase family 16 [Lasallia pustulata]SLM37301.1 hypothetical protein LPUS_07096 [Lasallia pustulata]
MGDKAGINRSLNTIRTELEYLRDSGVLSPPQLSSITAQLPQPGGIPSNYVDPQYSGGQQMMNPGQIAQQAQDPAHPANPQHPNHHAWVKSFASKLGNAATFGAGATMGSDLVNSIVK